MVEPNPYPSGAAFCGTCSTGCLGLFSTILLILTIQNYASAKWNVASVMDLRGKAATAKSMKAKSLLCLVLRVEQSSGYYSLLISDRKNSNL